MAVWGVVSSKYVLTAAGLLIAARIGQGRLPALIDPHAGMSAVSREFATHTHLAGPADGGETVNRRPLTIGIGAEEFDRPKLALLRDRLPSGAEMVIGRDILETHVLAIDTAHRTIALLGRNDVARLARNYAPVPLSITDDGQLAIPIALNGLPMQAVIAFDEAAPIEMPAGLWQASPSRAGDPVQVELGGARLSLPFVSAPSSATNSVRLSLGAFQGRTVVLDLPHDKLWISDKPTR
jgi:hypothetical protein